MTTGRSLAYLFASVAATVVFYVGSDLLGPVGGVGVLLVPFPAAFLHARYGRVYGGAAVALSAAAMLVLASMTAALQYLLLFGVGSFVLPLMLRRGVSWDRAWGLSLLTVVGVALLPLIFWAQGLDGSVTDQVRHYIAQETQKVMVFYQEADLSTDQLDELRRGSELLLEVVPRIYPGLIIASLGFSLLTLLFLLTKALRERGLIAGAPFRLWKTPEPLVFILIAAGFAAFLPWAQAQTVAFNVLIVLLPLYFLQGMAVVSCFLTRRGAPAFVRGLVCLLLVMVNPLPMVVTGVGLFDLWADFRKPKIKSA